MSRKKILCAVLAVSCIALFVNEYYISGIIAFMACALLVCLHYVNKLVRQRINIQLAPFGARSEVRNIDALIIGDMINAKIINLDVNNKTFLQLSAPDRNIKACYEILRHTHSILRDGGTVIIAVKKKYASESDFSIYDVQFFHRVTLEKYGLAKNFGLADLLRHPLRACIFAFGITGMNYRESECISSEINAFCEERNYVLRYFAS